MSQKLLFTPGPLTTSQTVKAAMLKDVGSRDFEFIETVRQIRQKLLALGEVASPTYEAILLQGSGTFGLEAVVSSITPPDGHWLFIINGAYGRRMADVADRYGLQTTRLTFAENKLPDLAQIEQTLTAVSTITHVACVHCETTTGIFNPIEEIGKLVSAHNKQFILDAMSSFGATPLNLAEANVDYLISSANKCIEGVPGFCFVLARRASLLATAGFARTVSLDLLAQWQGLEKNGQFRFTPPTHTLLAFAQALVELEAEGGVVGRAARYRDSYNTLVAGMRERGFVEYLAPAVQGYIITSFRYPTHPNFTFDTFYRLLAERDFVIYPGKVSDADCFRIGNIGHISREDIQALLTAVSQALIEMNVTLT